MSVMDELPPTINKNRTIKGGIDEDLLAKLANKLEVNNNNNLSYKYWGDVRDIINAFDEIIAKIQDDEWRGED